ncbi:hypothetical protein [Tumebacillus avium]|uniref:hypothetical protein n=1 Tax=Tumebacillus avium TaxID=1903704 RepID=UPI0012FD16D6|nr:hypothetical protein [Tumebacillus avium]
MNEKKAIDTTTHEWVEKLKEIGIIVELGVKRPLDGEGSVSFSIGGIDNKKLVIK